MTKKKKISIGIILTLVCILLFFEGRRISFSLECLSTEEDLKEHFEVHKVDFHEFVPLIKDAQPIAFDIYAKDTLTISFQDLSIDYIDLFIDSVYRINSNSKQLFQFNDSNCLEVVVSDTTIVCNHNWKVNFYGHYKDDRINELLKYYGWNRSDFEVVVKKVQKLDCHRFSNANGNFNLGYKYVSYYNDGIMHCFGHSDGLFDYMYTNEPDSFYWQESLEHYEDKFYGIHNWSF